MPQEHALITAADTVGFALLGYALVCACIALASPSLPLVAAGVLLPIATALALAVGAP